MLSALSALLLSPLGHAGSFSLDATDLWWNPSESGWGVNVVQQEDILFLTLFVYGQSGQADWYVGSDVRYSGTSGGALTFTGPWYVTTGPYFGGAFTANSGTVRPVGTATFTLTGTDSARFTYSVDGVSVTKDLTRQTFKLNNLDGAYIGARAGVYSSCVAPADNGYYDEPRTISITHTGGVVSMFVAGGDTCTFTGPYRQAGRMGNFAGNFSCNTSPPGTFAATQVETGTNAISMHIEMLSNCRYVGRIGGLRTGPS
jgi:hypothetical protein